MARGECNRRMTSSVRITAAADPVQAERDFIARQPMGRLAVAEDIAPQVVYLLSDESRFVTGQVVLVDGGVTIRRDGWCQAA